MDRARLRGRDLGAGAAQVEHEDLIAGAVHAQDAAADRRESSPAQSHRLPLRAAERRAVARRSPARRAASQRLAQIVVLDRARRAARASAQRRRSAAAARRRRFGCAGSGPWRKAILPTQRQPRWALTRSTIDRRRRAAPRARRRRRCAAPASPARVGASGSRLAPRGGHCSWIGRAKRGDLRADDLRPVRDRLVSPRPRAASAGPIDVADKHAERRRRRARGFVIARARLEMSAMERQSRPRAHSLKAGRNRRAASRLVGPPPPRPCRGAPSRARRPIPIGSGCRKCCCSRPRRRRRRPISRSSCARWPMSRRSPPRRSRR